MAGIIRTIENEYPGMDDNICIEGRASTSVYSTIKTKHFNEFFWNIGFQGKRTAGMWFHNFGNARTPYHLELILQQDWLSLRLENI